IVIKVVNGTRCIRTFPGWSIVIVILALQSVEDPIAGKVLFLVRLPGQCDVNPIALLGQTKENQGESEKP
ncbi:MAG: hypothetical protein PVG85_03690, partial [Deltaproteobacteria bacterium]